MNTHRASAALRAGIAACLVITCCMPASVWSQSDSADAGSAGFTMFPIVMYDTDIGFGYGLKLFLMNLPARGQSLDLLAFNSTKGERWYRIAWTNPDAAARLGTAYGWGVDVVVDYDTYVSNPFYGIGMRASKSDLEEYTREPLDVAATLRHAPSREVTFSAGVRWRSLRNMRFTAGSRLRDLPPQGNAGRVSYISLPLEAVYDTRNSYHLPTRGIVLKGEIEGALSTDDRALPYLRVQATAQGYVPLFAEWLSGAARLSLAQLAGPELPVQALLTFGGGTVMRGLPRERYLDRSLLYFNAELRAAVVWRLSMIAGLDGGRVWRSLAHAGFADWTAAPVLGLRLDMHDFIVRGDVGFGSEGLGVFLNFGHVF